MTNKSVISKIIISIFCLLSHSTYASKFKSGLVNGKLQACPDSPNCINTETLIISPINISKTKATLAWSLLQQVITEQGGNIHSQSNNYLSAIFKSDIFGFIDDVEARLDLETKTIHLRSASRVGYYDFGVNNRRLQTIIKTMQLELYKLK